MLRAAEVSERRHCRSEGNNAVTATNKRTVQVPESSEVHLKGPEHVCVRQREETIQVTMSVHEDKLDDRRVRKAERLVKYSTVCS